LKLFVEMLERETSAANL